MLIASDGLMRLVMAELVRERLSDSGEPEVAAEVVRVTGYREWEQVRYPGTSSTWTERYVDIFWTDSKGEPQAYEWRGDLAELTTAMELLVESY